MATGGKDLPEVFEEDVCGCCEDLVLCFHRNMERLVDIDTALHNGVDKYEAKKLLTEKKFLKGKQKILREKLEKLSRFRVSP